MAEPRKGLVERLFAEHRRALQTFFYRRIRTKSDAPDLTVVEGSVAVLAGQPPPGVTGLPLDALRVNAGYQVRVDARGSVGAAYPVDVQQAVTWLQRQDSFRTATTRRGGGRVQPLWLYSHRDR